MRESLRIKTAATVEPITLAEAQTHIRYAGSDESALVTELITAARLEFEALTGRQVNTATWVLRLDEFPIGNGTIRLRKTPVQSVVSVKYIDTDGVEQTIDAADYRLDLYSQPARLDPAYNESWPSSRAVSNAVTVEFKAGYGDAASDVPKREKALILKIVASLWASRGDMVPTFKKDDPAIGRILEPLIVELT